MNTSKDKRVETSGGGGGGRIRSLPDDVLYHILSFLPTKFAARAAVVSTTWNLIFLSSRDLEFDNSLASNVTDPCSFKFYNFVLSVLIRRNYSPIHRFQLRCTRFRYHMNTITSWVALAVCSDIQELDINVRLTRSTAPLPTGLYSLETLTTLKLSGKFKVFVPLSPNLPNLKIMQLKHMEFEDDDSVQRLFSHCPVLELLYICNCNMEDIDVFDISVPSLQKFSFFDNRGAYDLVLNADNLQYMHCSAANAVKGHLKSIARADIFLVFQGENELSEFEFEFDGLVNLICDVKRLALMGDLMDVMFLLGQLLPMFYNLTRLQLVPFSSIGWNLLPVVLASAPSLQVLKFDAVETGDLDAADAKHYILSQDVPRCLELHLRKIKFVLSSISEEECELVEYFLKNGSALKKVKVLSLSRGGPEIEMKKRLLSSPRKAEACQLVIKLEQCEKP